jgi:hypothetical protein
MQLMERLRQNYRRAQVMAHIRVLHELDGLHEALGRYRAAQQSRSTHDTANANAARPARKHCDALHQKLDRAAAWLAHHGCHPKAPIVAYHLERISPGWRHRFQAKPQQGRSRRISKRA